MYIFAFFQVLRWRLSYANWLPNHQKLKKKSGTLFFPRMLYIVPKASNCLRSGDVNFSRNQSGFTSKKKHSPGINTFAFHSRSPETYNEIAKIYKMQLSIPLEGMEQSYNDFKEFRDTNTEKITVDVKRVDTTYRNTLEILNTMRPFEEKLKSLDPKL
jgi:hypothetical protein